MHGLVAIQEVPRTALHTPKQTFYLFHVKFDRTLKALLNFCRWALGSLVKRRRHALASHARLLGTLERDDVKANQELIGAANLKTLDKLNRLLAYLDFSHKRIAEMIVVLE